MTSFVSRRYSSAVVAVALLLTVLVYYPGLSGGWFFDDYPNIVDNPDVQPVRLGAAELLTAAASSPASDIGRPLASLSFVANHAVNGMAPFGWKATNLALHLVNGCLVFLLSRILLLEASRRQAVNRPVLTAALIALGWLLLPINLTPVLMVVQRMESLANLFVLAGLIGYLLGRRRMLTDGSGFAQCLASLMVPTTLGALAKETAVMLPLYAALAEWALFRFRTPTSRIDRRISMLFAAMLVLPAIVGLAWLLPGLLKPETWATRDFTLSTRLLSEARIVLDYVGWCLLPLPQSLSFYHDDFVVSQGLLSPWTTLASMITLIVLVAILPWLARRQPLTALGIAWFLGAHTLTGTVLPLELVFEHRNYFASLGLLLALVPWLIAPDAAYARIRHLLLGILMLWWGSLTAWTAHAWGDPLRLAHELAIRAPESPRAQFGYGKALLAGSDYDPASPQFMLAVAALEHAGSIPGSSALPEQTLILIHSLTHQPVEQRWWASLITKLAAKAPSSENVDALGALTRCARNGHCDLPHDAMQSAFDAAGAHPRKNAKLLTIHGDWAWNVLGDRTKGEHYASTAVDARPNDADARITLARMNIALGNMAKAREQLDALRSLNRLGRIDAELTELRRLIEAREGRD